MGKATRFVSYLALALAIPSCGGDTGIVLEISLTPELAGSLGQSDQDFSELRVWVGHATDDPSFFRASDDAFFVTPQNRAGLASPYRYLLEPTGVLADIGPLVFAAAVGDDPEDGRVPFQIVGFAVADQPMGFGDGEVRVVPLALAHPDGVRGGVADACIVWDMNTSDPSRIAPADDLDCDGASGTDDCDDLDPRQNNLDRDGDGVASCAGDCMDDPRIEIPWVDPASVHPGALDVGENDPQTCDHIDEDCDGNCQVAGLDTDASGATSCGAVSGEGGFCAVVPADCDESRAGDQPATSGFPETCNGRDDSCDGFLPPRLPCLFSDGTCHWGQVACDEMRGEYDGEVDGDLHCKALPDGFSDDDAPFAFCDGTPDASCLEHGDPVACAYAELVPARGLCRVAARNPECRPDRVPLTFPSPATPPSCRWHVVGGTRQAEWEIGFVAANSTVDAAIEETIDDCTPMLAVRSHRESPAPRTVMLLARSPDDAAFGVRPVLVHLESDPIGECTGTLACQFAGEN